MEIGVSTATLFMRAFNEDALPMLDDLDARVVEVFLESFSEYSEDFGKFLAKRKGGLRVHSVHVLTTQFEPQLFEANPRAHKDAVNMFENVLKAARALGATHYTLHGKARYKKGVKFNDFPFYIDCFNEICALAKTYGVTVCLENVEWGFYNVPGFFTKVKDACPLLMTCLDVKQARVAGVKTEEFIDEMKGRIGTVHLSDVDENGVMCLPGKGVTDFKDLFCKLKKAGFDGDMLIENYKNDFKEVSEISDSLKYLRKLI